MRINKTNKQYLFKRHVLSCFLVISTKIVSDWSNERDAAKPNSKSITYSLQLWTLAYQLALLQKDIECVKNENTKKAASNILVTSDDKIKLCDFGLSRILITLVVESEDVNTNMSSNLMNVPHSNTMGTINYQAPEVHIEGKSYFVSDIWSFGVTMMEMWTGKMVSESIPGWIKMVTNKMKINLEPLKLISMEIKTVLVKAFHLDPIQRSSATDLLQCDMFRLNY